MIPTGRSFCAERFTSPPELSYLPWPQAYPAPRTATRESFVDTLVEHLRLLLTPTLEDIRELLTNITLVRGLDEIRIPLYVLSPRTPALPVDIGVVWELFRATVGQTQVPDILINSFNETWSPCQSFPRFVLVFDCVLQVGGDEGSDVVKHHAESHTNIVRLVELGPDFSDRCWDLEIVAHLLDLERVESESSSPLG
jgi:hypothetical protein